MTIENSSVETLHHGNELILRLPEEVISFLDLAEQDRVLWFLDDDTEEDTRRVCIVKEKVFYY